MKMTEQQMKFFHTFGFIAFPGLLNDRIEKTIEAFEETWKMNGGGHNGKPHDGKSRSCIGMYQTKEICSLLDDPRLVGIASSILGDEYNFMGGDGNFYVGDTGWHSDGWHANVMHIKIAFYLDPLTKDTGCLRVIPGSHKVKDEFAQELQNDLGRCDLVLFRKTRKIRSVDHDVENTIWVSVQNISPFRSVDGQLVALAVVHKETSFPIFRLLGRKKLPARASRSQIDDRLRLLQQFGMSAWRYHENTVIRVPRGTDLPRKRAESGHMLIQLF